IARRHPFIRHPPDTVKRRANDFKVSFYFVL
uniref:Uncharacterized protein n=1 Tax=Caenorhabditis japonica TaxID=281687 RepID=A0A8R1EJM4_CAEJA